jgi:Ca2+/Na+ antiporter
VDLIFKKGIYILLIIFAVVGLIFFKTTKKVILDYLFSRPGSEGFPRQPELHTNIVLILILLFLIMFGILGLISEQV